jgi:hypothetical protein
MANPQSEQWNLRLNGAPEPPEVTTAPPALAPSTHSLVLPTSGHAAQQPRQPQ